MTEQVVHLARLAQDSGCDGLVASPHEIEAVRAACGPNFTLVIPGVRPVGAALGDQKRGDDAQRSRPFRGALYCGGSPNHGIARPARGGGGDQQRDKQK